MIVIVFAWQDEGHTTVERGPCYAGDGHFSLITLKCPVSISSLRRLLSPINDTIQFSHKYQIFIFLTENPLRVLRLEQMESNLNR